MVLTESRSAHWGQYKERMQAVLLVCGGQELLVLQIANESEDCIKSLIKVLESCKQIAYQTEAKKQLFEGTLTSCKLSSYYHWFSTVQCGFIGFLCHAAQ